MFQGNKSDEQAYTTGAKKKQSTGWASLSLPKLVRNPYPRESKEQEEVPEKTTYFVDSGCFSPAWEPGLTPKCLLQLG